MLDEIVQTLTEVFFKDLNGGIHASQDEKPHKQAVDNDLMKGEWKFYRKTERL